MMQGRQDRLSCRSSCVAIRCSNISLQSLRLCSMCLMSLAILRMDFFCLAVRVVLFVIVDYYEVVSLINFQTDR